MNKQTWFERNNANATLIYGPSDKAPSLSIQPTSRDPREVLPIESLEEGGRSYEEPLRGTQDLMVLDILERLRRPFRRRLSTPISLSLSLPKLPPTRRIYRKLESPRGIPMWIR